MPTTTGKTNTGKKDPEGRTIWRGPRGALFVQKNGRNVQVATPTTARAASKWLGESSFTNHITLDEHKRKHGVVLRGKYYHPEGLRTWIEKGGKTVPHTGERMTNAEMRKHAPGHVTRADVLARAAATPLPRHVSHDELHVAFRVFDGHTPLGHASFTVATGTPFSTVARNFARGSGSRVGEYAFVLDHVSGLRMLLDPTSGDSLDRFAVDGIVTIDAGAVRHAAPTSPVVRPPARRLHTRSQR